MAHVVGGLRMAGWCDTSQGRAVWWLQEAKYHEGQIEWKYKVAVPGKEFDLKIVGGGPAEVHDEWFDARMQTLIESEL